MNKYSISLAAAALVFAGCASTSEESGGVIVDNDPDGIVCEKVPEIGSRLGKTVCTTREERDAIAARTREDQRMRQRSGIAERSSAPSASGN